MEAPRRLWAQGAWGDRGGSGRGVVLLLAGIRPNDLFKAAAYCSCDPACVNRLLILSAAMSSIIPVCVFERESCFIGIKSRE